MRLFINALKRVSEIVFMIYRNLACGVSFAATSHRQDIIVFNDWPSTEVAAISLERDLYGIYEKYSHMNIKQTKLYIFVYTLLFILTTLVLKHNFFNFATWRNVGECRKTVGDESGASIRDTDGQGGRVSDANRRNTDLCFWSSSNQKKSKKSYKLFNHFRISL